MDYVAEALREAYRRHFTEIVDRRYGLGSQRKSGGVRAARETVAGLVKLTLGLRGKLGAHAAPSAD
jgi:predicted ATP-dependent Lon-type protease